MKEIPLTQGHVAIVDDCDLERLSKFKWHFHKDRTGRSVGYAWRNSTAENGRRIKLHMHREVLGLSSGDGDVDHIDRNGLHNWRSNLRQCTRSLNNFNRSLQKNNNSGVCGVSLATSGRFCGKFQAYIKFKGKQTVLGWFETIQEAIAIRKEAENRMNRLAPAPNR